jgi:hypothetical protein
MGGMGIDYTLNGRLLTLALPASYTLSEVYTAFARILADPALDPPVNVLLDARHTGYGLPTAEIEALAEHMGTLRRPIGGRWAVVTQPASFLYAISRMLCCHAEDQGLEMEAFTSYDAAANWLLTPETV